MRYVLSLLIVLALCAHASAELRTQVIEYTQGDAVLEGYLAYDDAVKGKRPGVVVVHEWWGINPYIKSRVEQLAKIGYIAFAADIYGKGVRTTHPEEAGKFSGKYRQDRPLLRARAQAGLDILKKHDMTDPKKVAAIGYCFGGTTVLEMARGGLDVLGVASFHGGLDAPAPGEPKPIKAKILVLHGADDAFITPEQIRAFQDEMRKSGADWQMILFGGAVHGFTNPDADKVGIKGIAYNRSADVRSWEYLKLFFTEIFR